MKELIVTSCGVYANKLKRSVSAGFTTTTEGFRRIGDSIAYPPIKTILSAHKENLLGNRLNALTALTTITAFIALWFLSVDVPYFFTALIVGILAMTIDFAVEYLGIAKNEWAYPSQTSRFTKVPIELPILFFGCGVLLTFIFACFTGSILTVIFSSSIPILNLGLPQLFLIMLGSFFLIQYLLRRQRQSLIFGALPLSLALYLAFQEPWMLVISILPIYVDYYLEKHLVKINNIQYDEYNEVLAQNVALSYFPATLFILGLVAFVYGLLK